MNIQSAGSSGADLAAVRSTPAQASAEPSARVDGAAVGAPAGSAVAPRDLAARTERSQPATAAQPERDAVEVAVDSLNEFVASVQRDIRFQVDDVTGQAIVQVIDRKSETVVRQIPSEVALQLARQVQEDAPINLLTATG